LTRPSCDSTRGCRRRQSAAPATSRRCRMRSRPPTNRTPRSSPQRTATTTTTTTTTAAHTTSRTRRCFYKVTWSKGQVRHERFRSRGASGAGWVMGRPADGVRAVKHAPSEMPNLEAPPHSVSAPVRERRVAPRYTWGHVLGGHSRGRRRPGSAKRRMGSTDAPGPAPRAERVALEAPGRLTRLTHAWGGCVTVDAAASSYRYRAAEASRSSVESVARHVAHWLDDHGSATPMRASADSAVGSSH
jgi:hypothetical protein